MSTQKTVKEEAFAEWQKITADCKVGIKGIGPKDSKEILHRGGKYNRSLSEKHAQRLATKMTNGTWMFNGAPIVMNGDLLLDGQHRLHAVILSGKTLPCVVVEGVDPLAFRTFDIGKKRDFATALGIDGEDNPKELASAVNWKLNHTFGSSSGVDIEEKYELLNAHPMLRDYVAKFIDKKGALPGVSVGFLAATYSVVLEKDETQANDFFLELLTGEGENGNIDKLRETVEEIADKKLDKKSTYINSAFRQAWNATRAGKTSDIKMTLNFPPFK
jgi:hypothetical protein